MNTATKPRYTYNDIFETIREYHWMIRELERLKKTQAESSLVDYETKRRRQKRERAERFEERLNFVSDHQQLFTEEEQAILDCIMDGMTATDAAKHLCTYRHKISRTLEAIALRIYEAQLEGERK